MKKQRLSVRAYSAAMIDGEGTITLSYDDKKSRFRHPEVSVSSTTPELTKIMKTWWKGSISGKRIYKRKHSPSTDWRVSRDNAICFLSQVVTYLKEPEKLRRAKMILFEYSKLTQRNGKYSAGEVAKKLNFEKKFFANSKRVWKQHELRS